MGAGKFGRKKVLKMVIAEWTSIEAKNYNFF
ncbi:hypothetical protein VCSRO123_2666 [Vibrio cholerae]|nr:hypothetical protein VCSRO168_0779 [Vibrio cholerae]GHZ22710.1 hypothetical protein VCSRO123_2666 [Vibrio cholerae]